MSQGVVQPIAEPVTLSYEADLCGNIEQALKGLQGYGLMALELIQNADDAGAQTLRFDARLDALVVANDAEFSSCGLTSKRCPWEQTGGHDGRRRPCNFHAISRMGGRSKIHAPEQIGRFGIGFVSVYQVADTPIVRSTGTELILNPLTGVGLPKLLDFRAGTQFELPWASERSAIRDALNASPTPPDVAARVVKEVSGILRSSLLFLRHLERVEVQENGIVRLTVDIERTDSGITLAFGPEQRVESWLVLSREADDIIEERNLLEAYEALGKLDRSRSVSVAIPVDGEPGDGFLYAYLPTQQKTGMPLHINADFFPHASRQHIVLRGEGHERYWNQALLATAAAIIGENFILLRDALGPARLWQLGSDAFQLRENDAFGEFWGRFSAAAKAAESVWTMAGRWHPPVGLHLAPEQMPEAEQAAIASIGLELLDQSLRRHWTALSSIGVGELRLPTVIGALETLGATGLSGDSPYLRHLWAAITRLIEIARNRPGFDGVIKRLKAASFLVDFDGMLVSPDMVWRMPEGVDPKLVRRFIPDCRIVHRDALVHADLARFIGEYTLDKFASSLAAAVNSADTAAQVIGDQPDEVRSLYTLLTSFPVDIATAKVGATLSNTPLFRTPYGFISPSRGQLPGGFRDPTGYFEFIDSSLFPPRMEEFARDALGVSVLSFHVYIDDHLEHILGRGLSKEQYQTLLVQIVERKNELDDSGSLARLAECTFVRTRSGQFARPADCYFWTAQLDALLGDDAVRWVDNVWMPPTPHGPRLQDLLEDRLGMPITVAVPHIVARIEEIAEGGTPDEVAEAVTPLIRHIIERWGKFSDDDLEELRDLQGIEFLPAVVGDKRDPTRLYLPTEVYRAVRARGFQSQVPVIDLAPLRQASTHVNAFLDLLEAPDEPDTSVIVAHLQYCIATQTAPSDITYAMLNERVEDEDDLPAIDVLKGTAFIYDDDLKRFLSADHVFWVPPQFRGYWWAASGRMGQRGAIYRRLGVRDYPGPRNYAQLMLEIAGKQDLTESDIIIHSLCLKYLCEAYDRGDPKADTAIDELGSDASLLNVDGDPIWPEDAVWIDSEQLAAPFGSVLNYRLIQQPIVPRAAATRLFGRLGIRPISEIARLRLSAEPDRTPAEEATESLGERANLVLWLAPNGPSRSALRELLSPLEIQLSVSLRIQAEIDEFDPPVRSPVSSAAAFYEHESDLLHVEGSSMRRSGWPSAFRAIFAEIERHCPTADVKPLVMTAALIMLSDSREEAELALRSSGFSPPPDELEDMPFGDSLGAGPEEEVDEGDIFGDAEDLEAEHATSQPEVDLQEGYFDDDDRPESKTDLASGEGSLEQATSDHDREGSGAGRGMRAAGTGDGAPGEPGGSGYKSKVRTGEFGADEQMGDDGGGWSAGQAGARRSAGASPIIQTHTGRGERQGQRKTRTSRMLAYVARKGDRGKDDSERGIGGSDISDLIDIAAIRAALRYEEQRGWRAEEQAHGNPGYDIISTSADGKRRLIEVKGLDSDWTERGIKLSHVQYGMAGQHPEEYWIYVVENARDLDRQMVSAIGNPFQKVEEYWFDHNWRDTSEETASWRELNVRVGARVRHPLWKMGTIVEVEKRGIAFMVKVDFGGLEGVKYVPFNSYLQLID